MRITSKERSRDDIEFGIIYGVIALAAIGSARLLPIQKLLPACLFKGIAGIPCPTCGATRSVTCLSHGDVSAAFSMNPLIALICLVAIWYFVYSTIAITLGFERLIIRLSEREALAARAGAVVIVLLNWAYLVRGA